MILRPLLALVILGPVALAAPFRPLAQEFVIVGESPDPIALPLFSPSILRLADGRLVAAYTQGEPEDSATPKPWAFISTSDDGGSIWVQRAGTFLTHGRLFAAGKSLYYLGHKGDLRISRSDDRGTTWSSIFELTEGQIWHASACNVWHTRGRVFLAMERRVASRVKVWPVGELAPVLMRARESDDLTQRGSWTLASEMTFEEALPGQREDYPALHFFGVPFLPQQYPIRALLGNGRGVSPMGWLETNVVQIVDPKHYWYDSGQHTFHLFMRAHTGGVGFAAIAKVVENGDGSMTTLLERAPSGKTLLYLPLPGGQMRFHVLYDARTKLYWLLGSQSTDSMTRADILSPDRFDLPNNERHRLVLHFSRNMVDWCLAGVVAIGASAKESRHYASMDIDGEDLVILSRSGDTRAKSAHDGNLITFHRVKSFRDLIY